MVAGGPASMLASSVGGALSGQSSRTGCGWSGQGGGSRTPSGGGSKADAAAKQSELSEKKAELRKSEEKRDALKGDVKSLEDAKAKLADDAESADPKSSKAIELAELDKRLLHVPRNSSAGRKIAAQQTVISSLQLRSML
ncbi:hypothetical protein [Agrobacterium sp. T29]|uniref:hypothetical protein n=1 Tax=Agrobacterium sp. T29 TaxID=2580515 RepID=UPI001FEFE397|nr:hypothetical protein [Agrobacterium sp. T29]